MGLFGSSILFQFCEHFPRARACSTTTQNMEARASARQFIKDEKNEERASRKGKGVFSGAKLPLGPLVRPKCVGLSILLQVFIP